MAGLCRSSGSSDGAPSLLRSCLAPFSCPLVVGPVLCPTCSPTGAACAAPTTCLLAGPFGDGEGSCRAAKRRVSRDGRLSAPLSIYSLARLQTITRPSRGSPMASTTSVSAISGRGALSEATVGGHASPCLRSGVASIAKTSGSGPFTFGRVRAGPYADRRCPPCRGLSQTSAPVVSSPALDGRCRRATRMAAVPKMGCAVCCPAV